MNNSTKLPPAVNRYLAAANARDWAALASCLTDDAEFWTLGVLTARGPSRIADWLRESFGPLLESNGELTRVAADGTVVFVETVFRGRTPAGVAFEMNKAAAFELTPDGSAVTRVAAWFDPTQQPADGGLPSGRAR